LLLSVSAVLGDSTPPSLLGVNITTPVVAAGENVTVEVSLTDDSSGVNPAAIQAVLLDPSGQHSITVSGYVWTNSTTYSGTAAIGPWAMPGAWQVHYVLAYDMAGNGRMLLNGRDYSASFQVTNPNPDTTPPVLGPVAVAPDPVVLDQELTVTITISDDVSGVDTTNLFVNLTTTGVKSHHQVNTWTAAGVGRYIGSVRIAPEADPGPWIVHSVFARDLAGNAHNHVLGSPGFTVVIPDMPNVYRHPLSQKVAAGTSATLSVAAIGAGPLAYRWQLNGADVLGANADSYTTPPLFASNDGDRYRCIVSNGFGSDTSKVAEVRTGLSDYQALLNGQAPGYWFRLDNNLVNSGTAVAPDLSQVGGTFAPGFESFEDLAFAFNSGEQSLQETQDVIPVVGSFSFLFRTPDVPISGTRHLLTQGTETSTSNSFNLLFANPDLKFKAGNTVSTLITGQPQPGTWYYFAASWDEARDGGEVMWWLGPVGGSLRSGTMDLNNAAVIGDGGSLFIGTKELGSFSNFREDGGDGTVDEVAIWMRELAEVEVLEQFATTSAPLGFPFIHRQPGNRSTKEGLPATFSLSAMGDAPLTYQWHRDGLPIAGQTNDRHTTGPTTIAGDNGAQYGCTVSNVQGSVTSQVATLTVEQLPDYQATILAQTPDYWFMLDNDLANSGSMPAPDLAASGGTFSPDEEGAANSAFDIVDFNGSLQQANDVVPSMGSFSMLVRTPDQPFSGTRHLLAQGSSTGTDNAFNVIYNNADLLWRLGGKSLTLVSGAPAVGSWYYIAATWDESRDVNEVKYYFGPVGGMLSSGTLDIDNADVIGDGGAVTFGNKDASSGVAWRQPSNPGTLDEIAFWMRELSEPEVIAQFASTTAPAGSPFIYQDPVAVSIREGKAASFRVSAIGDAPLSFLWRRGGLPVAGETNDTHTTGPTTVAGDNGAQFTCVVSNLQGVVTSAVAALSVEPQPAYQVAVQGTAPDYWFKLDNDLANSGSQPAADLAASGGAFGDDLGRTAAHAYHMVDSGDDLQQPADLIAPTGSVSLLFRTPDVALAGTKVLLGQGNVSGSKFLLQYSPENVRLIVGGVAANVISGIPMTNTWYYVAVSWNESRDAGEVFWWAGPVGGSLSSGVLNINNAHLVGDGNAVTIGNRSASDSLAWRMTANPGTIDEVAFWGRELSEEEVTVQFNEAAGDIPAPEATLHITDIQLGNGGNMSLLGEPGVVLSFVTEAGRRYVIEWCDTLSGAGWSEADRITANSTVTVWSDSGAPALGRQSPFHPSVRCRMYRYRQVGQ